MHKASPFVSCYTLEFLKAIDDRFGRAVCGHNDTVRENSDYIAFLQALHLSYGFSKKSRRWASNTAMNLPSPARLSPLGRAATLPAAARAAE